MLIPLRNCHNLEVDRVRVRVYIHTYIPYLNYCASQKQIHFDGPRDVIHFNVDSARNELCMARYTLDGTVCAMLFIQVTTSTAHAHAVS